MLPPHCQYLDPMFPCRLLPASPMLLLALSSRRRLRAPVAKRPGVRHKFLQDRYRYTGLIFAPARNRRLTPEGTRIFKLLLQCESSAFTVRYRRENDFWICKLSGGLRRRRLNEHFWRSRHCWLQRRRHWSWRML